MVLTLSLPGPSLWKEQFSPFPIPAHLQKYCSVKVVESGLKISMKFCCNNRSRKEANATRITRFRVDPGKIGQFECFTCSALVVLSPGCIGENWGVGVINAVVFMYIILTLMWPVWSWSRWTFGAIAMRVLIIFALWPLCYAPWHFYLLHWQLPPTWCAFLWYSGPTITVQSPSSNTPNVKALEIYLGVTRKPRCLQTRDKYYLGTWEYWVIVKMGRFRSKFYQQAFLSRVQSNRFWEDRVWPLKGSEENLTEYSDSKQMKRSEFRV